LRTKPAVLVIVLLAFGRAGVTDAGAEVEDLAKDLFVGSGPPEAESAGGFADIRAVEAGADALPHVHLLRSAGIGAAEAHLCAIHEVVDRIPKRLIHVTVDVGVKADHLADGHGFSLLAPTLNVPLERRVLRS
jgi:hypothetical protein